MIAFAIFNSMLRMGITLVISFKLLRYGHLLNGAERIGLALAGGASFLTLAPLWDIQHQGTPYDGWAGLLLSVGFLTYLVGRLSRHIRHDRANDAHVRQLRADMASRER